MSHDFWKNLQDCNWTWHWLLLERFKLSLLYKLSSSRLLMLSNFINFHPLWSWLSKKAAWVPTFQRNFLKRYFFGGCVLPVGALSLITLLGFIIGFSLSFCFYLFIFHFAHCQTQSGITSVCLSFLPHLLSDQIKMQSAVCYLILLLIPVVRTSNLFMFCIYG